VSQKLLKTSQSLPVVATIEMAISAISQCIANETCGKDLPKIRHGNVLGPERRTSVHNSIQVATRLFHPRFANASKIVSMDYSMASGSDQICSGKYM